MMDLDIIFNDEERKWRELPLELRARAVACLLGEVPQALLDEVRALYFEHGNHWMEEIGKDVPFYTFHFGEGMMIRNLLRVEGGIEDSELPSGNWDDYYVPALLRAAGAV